MKNTETEAHRIVFNDEDLTKQYKTKTVEMCPVDLTGLEELYKRYPIYRHRDILSKVIEAGLSYYGFKSVQGQDDADLPI